VVAGDSLWLIAQKFNCSVKSLKKINNLTKKNLKPGQVLKIPPLKGKTTTPATAAPAAKPNASVAPKKKPHQKLYAKAQPVQDFDIPASTFASCPVPDPATVPDAPISKHAAAASQDDDTTPTSAPVAQLVTPEELSADVASTPAPKPKAVVAKSAPAPTAVAIAQPSPAPAPPAIHDEPASSSVFTTSSSKGGRSTMAQSSPTPSNIMSNDWAARFMQEARQLSAMGLEYDEDWRPPGESHAWAMDCSNTARYLYKVTTGIELPRTASDQYYYLHLQNKAWDVPQAADGYADTSYLRENLKPGDLLFWENTYRPERQPPITHVMVYLGTDDKGKWLMAGSQSSRGGLHNRRGGGPDIYVFDPHKPSGGYTTWLGLIRHKGRFCAYGRPLEADPSKLSVAAN
jgi:cell wall-associated NlpC family hydrolase